MKTRFGLVLMLTMMVRGESGYDAWLRYAPVSGLALNQTVAARLGDGALLVSAQRELIRGVRGMTGRTLRAGPQRTVFRRSRHNRRAGVRRATGGFGWT